MKCGRRVELTAVLSLVVPNVRVGIEATNFFPDLRLHKLLREIFTFTTFINTLNAELNPIRHLLALVGARHIVHVSRIRANTLNAELNPIHHLLALVGARHIAHVSRIGVNT